MSQKLPHAVSEELLYPDHLIMLGDISQGTLCIAEYEAKYISKGMLTQRAGHEARSNRCRTPFSVWSTHRCEPHSRFMQRYFFIQESLNSAHHVGFSGRTTLLDSGPWHTVRVMKPGLRPGKRYVLKLFGFSIRWNMFANGLWSL
jgi:hypothetical protein